MKFAKTFCKPSSTVTVVPAGLPVKLQYNEHGLLQKFTIGFDLSLDPTYEDPDAGQFNYNQLFQKIKQIVPNSLSTVSGGTTWIFGILYADKIPCDEGIIPQALYKSYIEDIISGGHYEFYAGYVHSLAASFKGPLSVRNFLGSSKFDLLPQIIVPLTMTEESLQWMLNPGNYPFKYSFISGFFIFEDLQCRYSASNLLQLKVCNNATPYVDADGYLKGCIETASGRSYVFNYSSIVYHNVTKNCTLLVERDTEANGALSILSTRLGPDIEQVNNNVRKEVKCPVCGKLYQVGGNDAPVQCNDPHCLSRLYTDAIRMLNILGLPQLSYNSYKALVDSKELICLTDLLELPPCKEVKISMSLAKAMSAVVPVEIVPNFNILERFANKCNNSVETVTYYLNNPLRIETDLDIIDPIVHRFADWLSDPYNVSTLTTLFSQVDITKTNKKFEGYPIFRGTTIAITGKFKRGDYSEIKSILLSYAANVVPSIELGQDLPNVLLIGSLNDGVSGQMVQKAKLHNIPIAYEDDFFTSYEIDKDLRQNLL